MLPGFVIIFCFISQLFCHILPCIKFHLLEILEMNDFFLDTLYLWATIHNWHSLELHGTIINRFFFSEYILLTTFRISNYSLTYVIDTYTHVCMYIHKHSSRRPNGKLLICSSNKFIKIIPHSRLFSKYWRMRLWIFIHYSQLVS
jgi:hypothetical protein